MRRIFLLFFIFTLGCTASFAQVPVSEDEFREKVREMGLDEDEVLESVNSGDVSSGEVMEILDERQEQMGSTEFIDPAAEAAKEQQINQSMEAADQQLEEIREEAEDAAVEEPGKIKDEEELILVQAQDEDVYGKKVFRNKSLNLLNQLEDFQAPDSYILGTGDRFNIAIWGASDYTGEFSINEEGFIKPPRMERIYLRGFTYKQAKEVIKSTYAKHINLKDAQMAITLSHFRLITVGIYGEVFQPGSYNMSALNSAFNALAAAGGPNENGTVRNITVRRSGQPDKTIDVYKYLQNPSIATDFYLEDNDIIHVPTAEKIVAIKGAVRRPFNYELSGNEGLVSLVDHAGGLNAEAYKGNIQIERYDEDERKLLDVDFRQVLGSSRDYPLMLGDTVNVYQVNSDYKNFVEVSGEVEIPGNYQLDGKMRVLDAVKKAGLIENSRLDQVYIIRREDDLTRKYIRVNLEEILENPQASANIELKPMDNIRIFEKSKFEDRFNYTVMGHVRSPGDFEHDQDLKVNDAIFFSGGIKTDAARYAYIKRIDGNDDRKLIRVDLNEVVSNPESKNNKLLLPQDTLVIYPKDRFEDKDLQINIFGAVREPGRFNYSPNMSLSDIVYLAGGLKKQAAEGRIEISRIKMDDDKQTKVIIATVSVGRELVLEGDGGFRIAPYDQIFVREAPEFELQQNIELNGEVSYPGIYTLTDKQETLMSVIQRAGGVTDAAFPKGATLYRNDNEMGQVILDLEKVLKNPDSKFNYVLKAGDIITIPKVKDLVSITGAVRYPGIDEIEKVNAPYHKGRRAKFYVNKYGAGVDRKEKKGRRRFISVENSNGYVQKTKIIGLIKIYPKVDKGAIVRVGEKAVKEKEEREKTEKDWGEIVATTMSQVSAILTLIILVDRTFTQ